MGLARDAVGIVSNEGREIVSGDASARLERGRYRSWADHGDPHALRCKLAVERLAKREHIGLASIVDRHAGPRKQPGDRGDIDDSAAVAGEALDKAQRQIGKRTDIELDHGELLATVEIRSENAQAKFRLVTNYCRLEATRTMLLI